MNNIYLKIYRMVKITIKTPLNTTSVFNGDGYITYSKSSIYLMIALLFTLTGMFSPSMFSAITFAFVYIPN